MVGSTGKHIVKSFDDDLKGLEKKLILIANYLQEKMDVLSSAIKNKSVEELGDLADSDGVINNLEKEVNWMCINILSLRQPMASDLRRVFGYIHIARNFERFGDRISQSAREFKKILASNTHEDIHVMFVQLSENVKHMMCDAVQAVKSLDSELAIDLMKQDDAIDNLYKNNMKLCLKLMREYPEHVKMFSRYILVSRSFERLGDYIVDIAGYIYFIAEGDFYEKPNTPSS